METFIRELKNLIKDYEERSQQKRNIDIKNRQLCNKFILGHLITERQTNPNIDEESYRKQRQEHYRTEKLKEDLHNKVAPGLMQFSSMFFPSTWVGAAADKDKSFLESLVMGNKGLGEIDETAGAGTNLMFDLLTPMMVGKGISLVGKASTRFPGLYRPTWDRIQNGYYGWLDTRRAYNAGAIKSKVNTPFFEQLFSGKGNFEGLYDTDYGPMAGYFHYHPKPKGNYIEGIGRRIYGHYNPDSGAGLYAVTLLHEMPNTYLFHIGGDASKQITREDKLSIGRILKKIPSYSYIGDSPTPTSGQIGMNYVNETGELPSLWKMILKSKMSDLSVKEPLSANSTGILTRGKSGELRYTNLYMSKFNDLSLPGSNNVFQELLELDNYPVELLKNLVNSFLRSHNKRARTAFIGLDGKLKIPVPSNFKTK